MNKYWNGEKIQSYDQRRDIVVFETKEEAVDFSAKQFIEIGNRAIQKHKFFAVALSGGSTPESIYRKLSSEPFRSQIDWTKVLVFWSDERNVPPAHSESNFRMAMDAGFSSLPILEEHIFRMKGEGRIEELEAAAKEYEEVIKQYLPSSGFDLVMLGLGEDGHTASLFPKTHGLHPNNRLAIANFIPQKDTWRLSLTFECINAAAHIIFYVFGENKAKAVSEIFSETGDTDEMPAKNIGTPTHKALWILDLQAAKFLYPPA